MLFVLVFVLFQAIDRVSSKKCRDGDLSVDPSDCSRFFKCSGGVPRSLSCPSGLLYNPQIRTCDWEENVLCRQPFIDEIPVNKQLDGDVDSKSPIIQGLTITPGGESLPRLAPTISTQRSLPSLAPTHPKVRTLQVPTSTRADQRRLSVFSKQAPRSFFAPPGAKLVTKPFKETPPAPATTPISSTVALSPEKKLPLKISKHTLARTEFRESENKKVRELEVVKPLLSSVFHRHLDQLRGGSVHRFQGAHSGAAKGLISSLCGTVSSEPLSQEVVSLRADTCTLPRDQVTAVRPARDENPSNVRRVESLLGEGEWAALFPSAHPSYTYTGFLQAVALFPSFCGSSLSVCRSSLATFLAHTYHETEGLLHIREQNCGAYCEYCASNGWVAEGFPCTSEKQYYGRGAKQLSWNYNYGQLSLVIFGDSKTLLDQPDLVATTWLNFASAIWFFINPQPPKPSLLNIVERGEGFGSTTAVINGGLECGPTRKELGKRQAANRAKYFRAFSAALGLEVDEDKLDCEEVKFNDKASIFWAPENGCSLASWQTAYSALIEGRREDCLASLD